MRTKYGIEITDDTEVGHIVLILRHDRESLSAEVRDNGCGLPVGFDIENTDSLGLSIVRDLITTQLGGDLSMTTVPIEQGGGTSASLNVPIQDRRGL